MTKEEFVDWKSHPTTLAAQEAVAEVCADMIRMMVDGVQVDETVQNYRRGFIRGVQAFLEWEPETFEEDNDDE